MVCSLQSALIIFSYLPPACKVGIITLIYRDKERPRDSDQPSASRWQRPGLKQEPSPDSQSFLCLNTTSGKPGDNRWNTARGLLWVLTLVSHKCAELMSECLRSAFSWVYDLQSHSQAESRSHPFTSTSRPAPNPVDSAYFTLYSQPFSTITAFIQPLILVPITPKASELDLGFTHPTYPARPLSKT